MKTASIYIEPLVYRKIMHWIKKAGTDEVSGLGTLTIDDDGDFIIRSAMLCKQVNSSGSTDLDEHDVNRAMFELRDAEGELRWWWHSHADMAVFWSGTDLDTIQKLGKQGWFVSTVFNAKEEKKSCIYMREPILVSQDDIPMGFLREKVSDEVVKAWDAEYDAKVEKKQYPLVVGGRGKWNEWDEADWYHTQGRTTAAINKGNGISADDEELDELNPTAGQSVLPFGSGSAPNHSPASMELQQLDLEQFADFMDADELHIADHNILAGLPWWDGIFDTREEMVSYFNELKRGGPRAIG